ncbi:MAG: MaoC family dehydratase [Bacillota bacterium]
MKRTLRVGDSAELTRKFTSEDIERFAVLTMDDNGIHTSEELAAQGIFRRPVIHGVFVGSLVSSVMGTQLPGHGTVLQEMDCRYTNPVYPGDEVTARVVLTGVEEQDRYYTAAFEGTCFNQDGVVVVEAKCRQLLLKRFFEVLE